MHTISKTRLMPFLAAVILVGAVACVDSPTSPQVKGKRSVRDTTVVSGDSTACRSGWVIMNGRIICNQEQ